MMEPPGGTPKRLSDVSLFFVLSWKCIKNMNQVRKMLLDESLETAF
jgi:hypothetical protein